MLAVVFISIYLVDYSLQQIPPICMKNSTTLDEPAVSNKTGVDDANFLVNLNCTSWYIEAGDFVIFNNQTAYIEVYNTTYDTSSYAKAGECIIVCLPPYDETEENEEKQGIKYSIVKLHITRFGLTLSSLCLLAHLIVFHIVDDLRNLPGYNLASLCACLLIAYTLYLVSDSSSVQDLKTFCVVLACLIQFFFLASFLWMLMISFDIFRSLLKATIKLRLSTNKFRFRRFACYSLCAYGFALLFVTCTLVLQYADGISDNYRPMIAHDICWFREKLPLIILFAAPLTMVMCANVLFFGLSAYIIYKNRLRSVDHTHRNVMKNNFVVHCRLAIIMGLGWIVGIMTIPFNADWLDYLHLLLNTTQGLFIFVAFTCSTKVKKYFRQRFLARKRKISTQSLPTFQSYWNTAMSMDHDLANNDVTVDQQALPERRPSNDSDYHF